MNVTLKTALTFLTFSIWEIKNGYQKLTKEIYHKNWPKERKPKVDNHKNWPNLDQMEGVKL